MDGGRHLERDRGKYKRRNRVKDRRGRVGGKERGVKTVIEGGIGRGIEEET
jgi:hypothetical protein